RTVAGPHGLGPPIGRPVPTAGVSSPPTLQRSPSSRRSEQQTPRRKSHRCAPHGRSQSRCAPSSVVGHRSSSIDPSALPALVSAGPPVAGAYNRADRASSPRPSAAWSCPVLVRPTETRALFAGSQGGTVTRAGGNTCGPLSARLDLKTPRGPAAGYGPHRTT